MGSQIYALRRRASRLALEAFISMPQMPTSQGELRVATHGLLPSQQQQVEQEVVSAGGVCTDFDDPGLHILVHQTNAGDERNVAYAHAVKEGVPIVSTRGFLDRLHQAKLNARVAHSGCSKRCERLSRTAASSDTAHMSRVASLDVCEQK